MHIIKHWRNMMMILNMPKLFHFSMNGLKKHINNFFMNVLFWIGGILTILSLTFIARYWFFYIKYHIVKFPKGKGMNGYKVLYTRINEKLWTLSFRRYLY